MDCWGILIRKDPQRWLVDRSLELSTGCLGLSRQCSRVFSVIIYLFFVRNNLRHSLSNCGFSDIHLRCTVAHWFSRVVDDALQKLCHAFASLHLLTSRSDPFFPVHHFSVSWSSGQCGESFWGAQQWTSGCRLPQRLRPLSGITPHEVSSAGCKGQLSVAHCQTDEETQNSYLVGSGQPN